MSIEEVPPKTPILDAAQARGGRIGFVAFILRPFKAIAERIHRRRVQKQVDERWHDALRQGAPDREDTP